MFMFENNLTILRNIKASIKISPDLEKLKDLLDMLNNSYADIENECERYYGNTNNIYSVYRGNIHTLLNYSNFGKQKVLDYIASASKDETGANDLDDLYNSYLLFEAPHLLDSFMLYMEKDRPVHERFYLPRRRIMKQLVDAIQDLADDDLDESFLAMPPRVGKLLADDTPILTSKGWKNHGDLVVGDEVLGLNGEFIRVVYVHPKYNTTHTVTMTDGSKFECHFRHEWMVHDRNKGDRICVYETQDLIGKLKNKDGHSRFHMPLNPVIEGRCTDLPVNPYTFGAWLGDGTNKKPRITICNTDYSIVESIINDGYEVIHKYDQEGCAGYEFSGLKDDLQKIGLCHSRIKKDKYIPEQYLTSSIEQRLELLAGLLDTDGTLTKKENRYHYSTIDKNLLDGIISLISSLGWRASVSERTPEISSSGICGKHTVYTVGFNPTFEIPCRVERKKLTRFSKRRRIAIKSIEESQHKQGNCITVDSPDGMYLAGRRLTPTHNTTILTFTNVWWASRNTELSNLYSAYSDTITGAFYGGCLELMTDPTYKYADIFPKNKIVATNSKEETIDLNRKKKYKSITCRSLYGTLNGACDCNGLLLSDDLLSGIEEALNPDRLDTAWGKVDNNFLPRAKMSAKILWCGTRWSIYDPAGKRMELLMNDEKFKDRRFKIISLPALNENDESNFNYDYGVGFDTNYYHQRRASFERNNDMPSWYAQYQQEPIEREGTLFESGTMNYYNGVLPDGKPDRIFMAVDVAFGGGDFTASPICYQYGDRYYIPDVVYDDNDKGITRPLILNKIIKHQVQAIDFEENKSTDEYHEWIETKLRKLSYKINLTHHPASSQQRKDIRIRDQAPYIREFYFLEDGKRSKEYQLFIQNVFAFKVMKKNKHDDAPDSLAMLVDMIYNKPAKVEAMRRPF